MAARFQESETRKVLRTMIGFMSPAEMVTLHKDRQLRDTDVPVWIEETLRKECKFVVRRLRRYEQKIIARFGHLSTVAEKLAIYHLVWDNWDGLEPCPYHEMRTLRRYFDSNIPAEIKERIRRAET